MGLGDYFSKLREGLARTRESIVGRIQEILSTRRTLDDEALTRIEEALLGADVGVITAGAIVESLKRRVRDTGIVTPEDVRQLLKVELQNVLHTSTGPEKTTIIPDLPRPYVIMVVGVNGAGKTTTVGKLAYLFRQSGLSVLIGAGDTFRAAANEQLEIWGKRAGVEVIGQGSGADPASVVYDTISAALARKIDVVLLDTAGRLHTKTNLMEELRKIGRVAGKRLEGAPHEVLLVIDGSTGQNGLRQAEQFAQASGVSGLVLTKLDGTAKGGIVFAIAEEHRFPVRFVGVGEGLDDLRPFDPQAFVEALLGAEMQP